MGKPSFQYKDNYTYTLSGKLNFSTVPYLWEHSRTILKHNAKPLINFDLTQIIQSDSSGVALLIAWTRMLRQQSQEACFIHLPRQMLAMVRVSDLEKILPIKI